MPRIYFHIIRVKAVRAGSPVQFDSRLPAHVTKVIGIVPVYTLGFIGIGTPPKQDERTGWMNIDFNSRRAPLGQFDVYTSSSGSPAYQDMDIVPEKGAIITGMYYQER